jgi:hypothetical protein
MAVTTRLDTITPAKAQKWLDSRASNRPLSESHVKRLASAIQNGEWEVNGETIKFNVKDEMVDGQHRCQAVVIAQTPIQSFVTRGLNDSTFDTIDIGRPRTLPAIFAKHGEKNYKLLAGATTWLWRHVNAYTSKGGSSTPRIHEAMDLLKSYPDLRDSVSFVSSHKFRIMSPTIAACLHYLFSKDDPELAGEFFDKLSTGENLCKSNRTSAIYWLRNQLLEDKQSTAKLPQNILWALAIKSWNAFRAGKVIKLLRYSPGNEQFPKIDTTD